MGALFGFWVGWRHGWKGVGNLALIVVVLILIGSLVGSPSDSTPAPTSTTSSLPLFWPAGSDPQTMCAQDGGPMAGQHLPAQVPAGQQVSCSDGSVQNTTEAP